MVNNLFLLRVRVLTIDIVIDDISIMVKITEISIFFLLKIIIKGIINNYLWIKIFHMYFRYVQNMIAI